MCPICNKKMSKHNNEKILDRNGSKNILMGVGCDHPICKGYPINFNEIYYKCINCNLDYCKNHAEKINIEENLDTENMKSYLRNKFREIYKY